MSHTKLSCIGCGYEIASTLYNVYCPKCHEPLDVSYDPKHPMTASHHWCGIPIAMPYHSSSRLITLGEGHTPSIMVPWVSKTVALTHVSVKLEYLNPTGSFKDRGTAVMMSMAEEEGVSEIVEDSSGNAGASISAYTAKAGIMAHVFVPRNAPQAKVQQISVYGAQIHSIEGSRESTTQAAIQYYQKHNLAYASHNLSPYFLEGMKTFAYELVNCSGGIPDHLIMPVGNGGLFIGAWKGFQELLNAGHIERAPRMHAIQAQGVMPIASEFRGATWTTDDQKPTIAGGISVAEPPRKRQVLEVLNNSGGQSIGVSEASIIWWQKAIAAKEGIYCEPTSAAAFAGLEILANQGQIATTDTVLVAVTGFGLKDNPPN